jgi:16S rRNA (guanine1207-N2)-methyltransferase
MTPAALERGWKPKSADFGVSSKDTIKNSYMRKPISELKKDIVFNANLRGQNFTFHSTWGLFSPQHIDEGTQLLIDHLEVGERDAVLDIGCGYGVIGLTITKLAPQGNVHMIDKDFVAVEYAKKNAEINDLQNCQVYLSNGFSHVPQDAKFDLIVSNLPAKPEREFFDILLADAKEHLNPNGKLYVVTINGLREFIKRNFQEVFGNYEKVKQGQKYTVGLAQKTA